MSQWHFAKSKPGKIESFRVLFYASVPAVLANGDFGSQAFALVAQGILALT